MKKIIITLLIVALCLSAAALAEAEDAGDFGFDFGDEGYTGVWTAVGELGIEFCLPEGWTPTAGEDGEAFAAVSGDGAVRLAIRAEAGDVFDIDEWARANLTAYEIGQAGFHDVLIVVQDERLTVRFVSDDDGLIAFDFERLSPEVLSVDFALEIVGSAYESWFEESFPFDESEDDEDVFAAFEFDGDV